MNVSQYDDVIDSAFGHQSYGRYGLPESHDAEGRLGALMLPEAKQSQATCCSLTQDLASLRLFGMNND